MMKSVFFGVKGYPKLQGAVSNVANMFVTSLNV